MDVQQHPFNKRQKKNNNKMIKSYVRINVRSSYWQGKRRSVKQVLKIDSHFVMSYYFSCPTMSYRVKFFILKMLKFNNVTKFIFRWIFWFMQYIRI